MKYFSFFAVGFLFCTVLFAETATFPAWSDSFNWRLFFSGSFEGVTLSGGTIYNRDEFRLNYHPFGLALRVQILDRRPLNFDIDEFWGDPEKQITNYQGALYHKPTGSRFLLGTLDEWGLSARIRNPWIRSPPYAENHKPLIADLKTAASSTKNDEAYLYLSSPAINIMSKANLKSFIAVQTEIPEFKGAITGGFNITLLDKTGIFLETFYTGATLPPVKSSSWFNFPPPLPERDFKLYAAGFLFHNQFISASADWAFSDTFAWGTGIYWNLGFTFMPLIPFWSRDRPLSISLAADAAGERFVYRDGLSHGAGFRSAGKIEWKGKNSLLLRFDTVLESREISGYLNRSSTGFYYRFAVNKKIINENIFRFTRISFNADRNAENPEKISDKFNGYVGMSLNLSKMGIKSPLGINFSGTIRLNSASEGIPSPFPVPDNTWNFNSAEAKCDFSMSPSIFLFKFGTGYTIDAQNNDKWDISLSSTIRFKQGRLTLKTISSDFPEKWLCNISWGIEVE
ncbi:MAG: hypothetical protein FWC19_08840 [Treponema sp.]|nr:hypothetical protein [Treponema sp.]MCL2272888.1 hypothetical protein [Treponema sp.]